MMMIMTWVFWMAAVLIAYTYAGYAAWLWLRSGLRPWPVRRGAYQPSVSILMAVRNEESALPQKLRNLFELDYPADLRQIVVVSDGSTDRTEAILREHSGDSRFSAVLSQLSEGKAASLSHGLAVCQGDVVLFTDARQSIECGALRMLVENFADPEVGAASGELMLGDPADGEKGHGVGLYWRIEKRIRELESASGSVVGATGALYAVRREFVTPIPEGTILDDVYIPMQVVRKGKRVVFDGRARAWDRPSIDQSREFSRKVRTLSGNYQLLQLAPWILSSSNPIRFEYVSHKLLRLAVPFALLGVLVSAVFLPQTPYRVLLIAQLSFYALALLGLSPVKIGLLKRLGDTALTFVVLNTAAAVAFANFVFGRKVAWTR
jgi:poly-beta-1,6-N-acetyl-D-glucosamine synthase